MSLIHEYTTFARYTTGPLLNSEVSAKIRIPDVLRYSCRYFAQHFQEPLSENHRKPILDGMKLFMTRKFLYWVEVMGLLDELPAAENSLRITYQGQSSQSIGFINSLHIQAVTSDDSDTTKFISDALIFLRNFSCITRLSTLQIYSSTIVFMSAESIVKVLITISLFSHQVIRR